MKCGEIGQPLFMRILCLGLYTRNKCVQESNFDAVSKVFNKSVESQIKKKRMIEKFVFYQ